MDLQRTISTDSTNPMLESGGDEEDAAYPSRKISDSKKPALQDVMEAKGSATSRRRVSTDSKKPILEDEVDEEAAPYSWRETTGSTKPVLECIMEMEDGIPLKKISTSSTKPTFEDKAAEVEQRQPPLPSTSLHKHSTNFSFDCRCCPEYRLWTVVHAVLIACIMTFLVGTTLAFSSPVLLELTKIEDDQLRFDTGLADIFGASPLVGAIFGGPIAGYVADRWGRKFSLVLNSLSYLVGYFIILSVYLITNGVVFKTALMVGRFITGIGMGWSYVVVPVYIGEVTPTELRSIMGTLSELSLTIGILVLYGLGSIPGFQYFDLALVQVTILVPFLFLVVWIPETPWWLLLKLNDKPRTIAVLKYLRGQQNRGRITREFIAIQSSLPGKKLSVALKLRMLITDKTLLTPFLLVTFVYIFQKLCGGGTTVVSYAGQIFQAAGAPNPDLTSTYAVGGTLVVVTILASLLIERMGRKVLLSVSAAGMLTGSTMLGIHSYLIRPGACLHQNNTTAHTTGLDGDICNPHLFPVAVVGVIIYILSFSFGAGPVPWVMLSEYLPLRVRGVAGGIVVASNWSAAVFITGGFLSYSELVGGWFAWWTLGAINLVGLIIIVVFMKETKGKTLEEIEETFKNENSYSFCKCCRREEIDPL